MPEYVTQLELTSFMPLKKIQEACEDRSGDQSPEEVWESICQAVSDEIDGLMAPRYARPFPGPVHPTIKTAARWLTLEALYVRRGSLGEANPATTKADAARKGLREIGAGKILLDIEEPLPAQAAPSVAAAAATEPLRTRPSCGGMLF